MARPITMQERLQHELFGDGYRCSRCADPLEPGTHCDCIQEQYLMRADQVLDLDVNPNALDREEGVPF